jgi:hypothetical protein
MHACLELDMKRTSQNSKAPNFYKPQTRKQLLNYAQESVLLVSLRNYV